MNFNVIYNAILNKVAREAEEIKSKKGFDILENRILNTPSLAKQYTIFNTFKEAKRGMSEDEGQNLILFVERYCSKLNYAELDSANRDFAKYFNIDLKTINKNAIDESIDHLIRFNTGGTVVLSEGTKYRKTLLNFLSTAESAKENIIETKGNPIFDIVKPEFMLSAMLNSIRENYKSLNKTERQILEAIRSDNPTKLEPKLQFVEAIAKRLYSKEKAEMLKSSSIALREKLKTESIEEVAYKVLELHKNAVRLTEGEFGGGHTEQLKDLTYIKNIQFGCFDDRDKPETIILRFTISMYPLAATYMDYNRAAKDLDKRLARISRNATNQTIFQSTGMAKQFFTGEGIWDSSVRSEGLRPGQATPGHIEWWLYTVQDNNSPRPIEAYKPAAYEILQKLDGLIAKWIPEVDPKSQQDYMAMLKEPVSQNDPTDDDDEVEDDWNKPDADDMAGEHEPSAKDIAAANDAAIAAQDNDDDDDDR